MEPEEFRGGDQVFLFLLFGLKLLFFFNFLGDVPTIKTSVPFQAPTTSTATQKLKLKGMV